MNEGEKDLAIINNGVIDMSSYAEVIGKLTEGEEVTVSATILEPFRAYVGTQLSEFHLEVKQIGTLVTLKLKEGFLRV